MTKEDLTMLDEHIEQDIAQLLKDFSNPTRIKIIFVLKNKPLTVSQICRALNMSQSAISHQLRELKMARLVTFKKQGRETLYQLDDKHVHDIFDLAIEHVKEIYHYD